MDRLLEFASNHPILLSGAVFLTILTIANEVRTATRRGVDLSPQDAVGLINGGATVIDVRSFERFAAGHIINAKNIPLDELDDAAMKKLGTQKDKPVILYDDNGLTGGRAVNLLRGLEFANVANIKGGITAWARDNFPLESGK